MLSLAQLSPSLFLPFVKVFDPILFWTQKCFWTQNIFDPFFPQINFCTLHFFAPKIFGPYIWTQIFFTKNFVWWEQLLTYNFCWPKIFLTLVLGHKIFQDKWGLTFLYQILTHKPKCTWEWSLTLALAQLVSFIY